MFAIYRAISWLISPFIPLYLRSRIADGKEDEQRINERYGKTQQLRPTGKLIWIHAASMGEVQSIMPLINILHEKYVGCHILLTTVTITSAQHFAAKLPERAFHQFAAIDTPLATKRFINHWNPDLSFFVDSELWPNMLYELRKNGKKAILLNGRISDNSMKKWGFAKNFCAQMLQSFTYVFAKSQQDASNFKSLGASEPICYGNLKFAAPTLEYDAQKLQELVAQIGDREVWLAASTHSGEEDFAAIIQRNLQTKYPEILTIIVPRHAKRGDEIAEKMRYSGLNVAQRSKNEQINSQTEIYLADTMGELGIFYKASKIAFIGGSLVAHGGQNPLEAARLNCAIIYGSHMDNFREFSTELQQNNAAIAVKTPQELENKIDLLLSDADFRNQLSQSAQKVIAQNQDVLPNILHRINHLLDELK